jgi:pyruvate dehydrogenase E2 component (dihydrolipoamide acetyltransferase)
MTEVKVPKLGDNIEKADVLHILVAVGDTIVPEQSIVELESDKASVEIPSPVGGVVTAISVATGDSVQEGQVLLTLEEAAAAPEQKSPEVAAPAESVKPADTPAPEPAAAPTASGPVEVKIPKLGDNIDKADILSILVSVGDTLEKDQSILELESDKASVEIPSPAAGVVTEIRVQAGDSVSEGTVVLLLSGSTAPAQPAAAAPSAPAAPAAAPVRKFVGHTEPYENEEPPVLGPVEPPSVGNPAPASPTVRRFARELGVDIHQVAGSGPKGRITQADVQRYVKQRLQQPVAAAAPAALAVPDMPDFARFGPVTHEKLSNVRRATAEQMTRSWTQIPHVTQFDQADITDVETFRKAKGKLAEAAGGKLTVTAILLKLCAMALKRFPKFNASIDLKNQEIIYKQYYHVGVAVDTPRGLLVPVIRDADTKGVIELSIELGESAKKARDRKLGPDDLQGATFTITNLGGLGTSYFTPIVNWPEVAILGVGKAQMQPVWKDGAFVPRMIMPLSISYDHRLIDGADAARFLRWIAEALENPFMLLLE